MSEITFNVGGRLVTASELAKLQANTKAPPKPKKERPAEWHKGWLVEGFRPGFVAEAERLARERWASWQAMEPKDQQGKRPPQPWDEDRYVANTKPKKVRAKPYEVASAAEACAELARRSGWTHVSVRELKQEKSA